MAAHIFVSAHLDDAVFSCGGLIHRLVSSGESVTVVTAFAGDPPKGALSDFARDLHVRWNVGDQPVEVRRQEDRLACRQLGAQAVHLGWPEALYRRNSQGQTLYPTEAAIFGPLRQDDPARQARLADELVSVVPEQGWLYLPVGLGGHVDHGALRRCAESFPRMRVYYREFPYLTRGGSLPSGLDMPDGAGWVFKPTSDDLAAWGKAAACYRSQLSTFWKDEGDLRAELVESLELDRGQALIVPPGRLEADPGAWQTSD
jgi:LmbE family N-acetylglucosaminyl deacetylase